MTTDRLTAADALIWHIQGDPVLRSPIVAIGLLDRMPSWTRVQSAMARAAQEIPRLRQRLDANALGGRPRWVDDEAFSLDHHVRLVRAPTPSLRAVLDLAEPDVMTAFDPARPLWQLVVVDGLDGGRAAFILRFHHTITDGVGGIELAERIFDRTRRGDTAKPATPAPAVAAPDRAATSPAAPVIDLVMAGLAAALDPLGTARTAVRTTRSVAKILAPAREPLSPILLGRGLDRRLHLIEVPFAALHDAAKVAGGTVNDLFLAAVGGGLRAYHEACGSELDAMRVTMPISLRKATDEPGGNRFTPARFILPIDDPDPVRRAELAGAIVRGWRGEPAVGMTPAIAWLLERLPPPLIQRAFAGMLRSMDVDAVDVPGLSAPAYFAGAQVDRLWAFAPPTGAAMSVTLVSHQDTACIGIAADLAAVADPELLASCLEHAFDEVLALAPGGLRSEMPA